MEVQLQDLQIEGERLLKLDRIELKLRYTDWAAKVKVVVAEVAPSLEPQIKAIETNFLFSLRQRTVQIVAVLELLLRRTTSA